MTERTARLLVSKLEALATRMEHANLAEYVQMLNRPGRMLYVNLMAGMARGLGMAIGFTFLGALFLFVLTRTFVINLPVIGSFIAELVRIVEENLQGP